MRYIADSNGYLLDVSFGGDIACGGASCVEYAGDVPAGYDTLAAWYLANAETLYRWRVVSGSLTEDTSKAPPPAFGQYAPQYSKINNANYWGVCLPDGTESGWLRAPSEGIIPNINDSANGNGKLGTQDFPWKAVYGLKLFTNGSQPLNELTQWTPTLGVVDGSGTAPTVSYSAQVGRSWRFGWVTFFYFRVVATITSPGTGYALINGLPFACLDGHYFAVPLSENLNGLSDGSNANKAFVYQGTYIRIQSSTGAGAVRFASASPMYLSGSGWYEIS